MNRIYTILCPFPNYKVTEIIDDEKASPRCVAVTFEGENLQVTDSYHTMEELYEHRIRLYLALVKIYDNYITPMRCNVVCWKSKLHDDGTSLEGWFILGMVVTKTPFETDKPAEKFDIGYHIPLKYWHLANVIELPKAPKYDGYTPNDVLKRLLRL